MAVKTIVTMNRVSSGDPITGNLGEITFDLETMELRYHDGITPGGFLIVGENSGTLSQIAATISNLSDMMGEASGIATLDSNGKIPIEQLPEAVGGTPVVVASPSNLDGGFF